MEEKGETRPTTELNPIDFYGNTEKKDNPDVTMQPGISNAGSMVDATE